MTTHLFVPSCQMSEALSTLLNSGVRSEGLKSEFDLLG